MLFANATFEGAELFHTDHNNTFNVDLSSVGLAAVKAGMLTHSLNGIPLHIRPKYLVVPAALEQDARELLFASLVSGGGSNTWLRDSLELLVEPRIDAEDPGTYYLFGDPNVHDTIEVAYLNGVDQPVLEGRQGFNVDGIEFKARLDFGVAVRDYRAMARGTGA